MCFESLVFKYDLSRYRNYREGSTAPHYPCLGYFPLYVTPCTLRSWSLFLCYTITRQRRAEPALPCGFCALCPVVSGACRCVHTWWGALGRGGTVLLPRTHVWAVLFICPQLRVERVLWFHFPITKCAFSEKAKENLCFEAQEPPRRRRRKCLLFSRGPGNFVPWSPVLESDQHCPGSTRASQPSCIQETAPPLFLPHKGSCQSHLPISWPYPGPEPRM